jgi:uncharacterized protein (TIGR03437 family)
MKRERKILVAKIGVVMGTIPLLIWAHAAGPDVGASGVPGEGTCARSGCHLGTTANPAGSVSVTFPSGMTYTPGTKQHLVVTISNPTARVWGFQLTARLASATGTMAGSFASTDAFTAVLCLANPTDPNPTFLDFGKAQNCPASKPLAYIEHTLAGSQRNKSGSQTFEFDWNPPATSVGSVAIYVAGNAANGNGNETGDQIYNTSYTLTPGGASGNAPTISSGGVQNGASFQAGIVPNSWITIKGSSLASTTDTWDKAIVNGQLPTTLDNVSVSVGNKPAYIYFVSPTQVNAVAPDVGAGSMQVTVTNGSATSAAMTADSTVLMPAFFLWTGNQVVATRQDGTWAVKNGTFSGTTTIPAKPGEVIVLWGTGFGPTSPAAPVGVPTPAGAYYTATPVTATIGGIPADVYATALSPGYAGLYQVAVTIPASAPNGDLPVVASIGGAQSPSGVTITVQK